MDTPEDRQTTERDGLTPDRIDSLLAKRKRKSYPKSCYPCRHRKVRCDHNQPCGSCVRYDQPELCVYFDNKDKRPRNNSVPSDSSTRSRRERLAALADLECRMQTIAEEVVRRLGPLNAGLPGQGLPLKQHEIQEGHVAVHPPTLQRPSPPHDGISQTPRHGSRQPTSSAVSTEDNQIGAPVHVGAESLASALVDILKSGHGQFSEQRPRPSSQFRNEEEVEEEETPTIPQPSAHETMKLLYMTDTGSTYPFANLWKPGATVQDICFALPDDDTFEQYANSA